MRVVGFNFSIIIGHSIVSSQALAGTKPNIIFLFADDQRADAIEAYGNPYIQMPNLDQLAANGFRFRRIYCAGSFRGAVCVASRAMLMTGRSWKRIPSEDPTNDWNDLPLLPSVLESNAGYCTSIIGKWHNGTATLQRAFFSGQSGAWEAWRIMNTLKCRILSTES